MSKFLRPVSKDTFYLEDQFSPVSCVRLLGKKKLSSHNQNEPSITRCVTSSHLWGCSWCDRRSGLRQAAEGLQRVLEPYRCKKKWGPTLLHVVLNICSLLINLQCKPVVSFLKGCSVLWLKQV